MSKHYPHWQATTIAVLLLSAVLAGCASPPRHVPLPQASKAQAPADLMRPAPAPSSFLIELKTIFSR